MPDTQTEKTRIEIPAENYVKAKAASGSVSRHNGDVVAAGLAGLTIEEVRELASEVLDTPVEDLEAKYAHLNVGQQRMNLGNRLRGAVAKMNRAHEKDAEQPNGDDYFAEVVEPFREAVAEREAAAEEAKAAKEAARAKKAEPEEDVVDGDGDDD